MSGERKLMVFISSTYTDLLVERQAAVSAILKSGNIPAGMELFSAGDKSQLTTIKRWIDQSDVYMLILGGRYGSIEPESGVSYTEIEYDYAVNQGKPFFAVVIKDDALEEKVKLNGTSAIEKDNPQLLKQFKEKVLSSVSSFFSDEKDIRLSVHESLGDLQLQDEMSGWVRVRDVENVTSIKLENETLTLDKKKLLAQLESQKGRSEASGDVENSELLSLLTETQVNIPTSIQGENPKKDLTRNLLDVFSITHESFVTGVTNSVNSNNFDHFLYSNVGPKLQVFGLVDNEKIAGVKYRRSFLTKKGIDFAMFLKRTGRDEKQKTKDDSIN